MPLGVGRGLFGVNYVRSTIYHAQYNESIMLQRTAQHTRMLLLDRWVGVEGVLAISSYSDKGWALWLSLFTKNVDEIIVQSPSMKRQLETRSKSKPISILPFTVDSGRYCRNNNQSRLPGSREYDFLYVASGEPHKNHRLLVAAWCQLAKEQFYPSLLLTLDQAEYPVLCKWINQKSE